MASLTDTWLMRRIRVGDQTAAAELYRRYACQVRSLARTRSSSDLARLVDEEDITQSVFADFFFGARQGQYQVPAGTDIWRILLVIALNKIRAKGRFHHAARRDTRKTVGDKTIDDRVHVERAADRMARAYIQIAFEETIELLPPVHKQIVLLRMEGFEVAEISTKVECSKRSVERALHEFREIMEEVLRKDS